MPDRSIARQALRDGHLIKPIMIGLIGPFTLLVSLACSLIAQPGPTVSVYAEGFLNPRGLAFGADGALYVAEAGTGGRTRVVVDTGKRYNIGLSGRISRVATPGQRSDYLTGLPSAFTSHDDDVGPASLTVLGDSMYLLTAAGGTEVGDPQYNNGVFRMTSDGLVKLLDLNDFNLTYPSQARLNDPVKVDVPGGMPWGIATLGNRLYVTEANHEFILEVTADGQARRILEHPHSNRVFTGISAGPDGWLYVAELGPYPYLEGSGDVIRVSPAGEVEMVAQGLTTPIAATMTREGVLYVLEFSAPLRQVPNSGRVIRILPSGEHTIIHEKLHFPTAMIMGEDGALYISNSGHLANKSEGQIVRIKL
ncbi:MAG: ScyD/ScyE family protein [Chloroflexota bacterium]